MPNSLAESQQFSLDVSALHVHFPFPVKPEHIPFAIAGALVAWVVVAAFRHRDAGPIRRGDLPDVAGAMATIRNGAQAALASTLPLRSLPSMALTVLKRLVFVATVTAVLLIALVILYLGHKWWQRRSQTPPG